ncbi:discoidin domain-containing protein [Myxococcus sp. K15C18031901]|uniref:discoidin domain-containing protein n=1 Tax=Myxococcus dinghuensis TaxID=2906761 RepID=UPI0020A7467E|nr:discoidin domain-containing protein [Myxococcus dinghuensis]MCP3104398.1 discoidin domain-containing protein [Myxococcus dinghuensis]
MRRLPLALLMLASAAPAASNAPPGYAQASDYLERERQPERYAPLNLLDGRDTTAWCATGDTPAPVTIGFKDVVTVDEVRIYTGDATDKAAYKAHARARKLILTSLDTARSFKVEDKRGLQNVPLSPALTGNRFTLEVVERFPGAEATAPVCVTDIVFYSGGKALNGTWLAQRLKYDARLAPVLGTWFGGMEGAPDRFLSIFVDGTYLFSHEPLEGAEPTTVTGTYTLSGTRLTLDVPKQGKATVKWVRGDSGDGARTGGTLELEGAPAESWGRVFRNQP